jgi:hypothetical protein
LETKERKIEDGAIPQSSPPPRVCAEKVSSYCTTGHTTTLLRREEESESESETMPAG